MSERCQDTALSGPDYLPQALSIHTRKITDACRDKDCIEDLRVYLTQSSQCTLDSASSVRVRCADLLYAYIDVEPVAFDRNHYCVDVTFYYRILADAVIGTCRPTTLCGLASFSKRAVLCGEESRAHIFTSQTNLCGADGASQRSHNRPTAVVEVLDPMVLSSKVRENCDHGAMELAAQIPEYIKSMFDEELTTASDHRKLFVTLGQFSIIRMERDAQIVVEVIDYAIPSKECSESPGCCAEDPCEMFSRIPFPTRQFVPTGCDHPRNVDTFTSESPCCDNCDE
jgi:hypothetical protein